jgi:hypothetical protein
MVWIFVKKKGLGGPIFREIFGPMTLLRMPEAKRARKKPGRARMAIPLPKPAMAVSVTLSPSPT